MEGVCYTMSRPSYHIIGRVKCDWFSTPPVRRYFVAINLDTLQVEKISDADCRDMSKHYVCNYHYEMLTDMSFSKNADDATPLYDENLKCLENKIAFVVIARRANTYFVASTNFKVEATSEEKIKQLLQLDKSYVRNAYLDKYNRVCIKGESHLTMMPLTGDESKKQKADAYTFLRNVMYLLSKKAGNCNFASVGSSRNSGPVTVESRLPGYKLTFKDDELHIAYNNTGYSVVHGARDTDLSNVKNDDFVINHMPLIQSI